MTESHIIQNIHTTVVWMPCKPGEVPRPAPAVLSEAEAIEFLRIGHATNPQRTMAHWRSSGKLPAARTCKNFVYRIEDLLELVKILASSKTSRVKIKAPTTAYGKNRKRRVPHENTPHGPTA